MQILYFRKRRTGPEAALEAAVANSVDTILSASGRPIWLAGSMPIGGGMPDLTALCYEPAVAALTGHDQLACEVLACLRSDGRASLNIVARRMGRSPEVIAERLTSLVLAEAVTFARGSFSVSTVWREILPDVVTVEAKVSNWRKAIDQAKRNRLFAHRSFVALPERVATRVCRAPEFRRWGVGLLSVLDDDRVEIIRNARQRSPQLWAYYYRVAVSVARYLGERSHAVRCAVGRC